MQELMTIIRARICLAPMGEAFILREGNLAAEFDMSRTPVRQVLQALQTEGMVEIRTGFGTVARRLDPEERTLAFIVFRELADSAANVAYDAKIPSHAMIEFSGISRSVQQRSSDSIENFVEHVGLVGKAMGELVQDDVLRNALLAAHWRITRWRTSDFQENPAEIWDSLTRSIKRIEDSLPENSAAHTLRTTAGLTKSIIEGGNN